MRSALRFIVTTRLAAAEVALAEEVSAFADQVELASSIGEQNEEALLRSVRVLDNRNPGAASSRGPETGLHPERLDTIRYAAL
jgi:hypothetical protein